MAINKDLFINILSQCESGDILLCRGPFISICISGFKLMYYPEIWAKGKYTHAGLFDKERFIKGDYYCILSASNKVKGFKKNFWSLFGEVGYESISKWLNEDLISIYRINGYSQSSGTACISYLQPYIGKSFYFTDINKFESFYCSKLIVLAWNSQGVQFEVSDSLTQRLFMPFIKYYTPNIISTSKSIKKIYELY